MDKLQGKLDENVELQFLSSLFWGAIYVLGYSESHDWFIPKHRRESFRIFIETTCGLLAKKNPGIFLNEVKIEQNLLPSLETPDVTWKSAVFIQIASHNIAELKTNPKWKETLLEQFAFVQKGQAFISQKVYVEIETFLKTALGKISFSK